MAVTLVLGELRQVATLTYQGDPASDGDGGYTHTPVPLDPSTWRCKLEGGVSRTAQKAFGPSSLALATHTISGRFHSGITTKTLIAWTDRAGANHSAAVIDVDDTEGAGVETVALLNEIAR